MITGSVRFSRRGGNDAVRSVWRGSSIGLLRVAGWRQVDRVQEIPTRPRHRTSALVAKMALMLLLECDGRLGTGDSRSWVVVIEQAPESLVASDGSVFVEWPTARHDELIANAVMVPFKVIVPGEFADR